MNTMVLTIPSLPLCSAREWLVLAAASFQDRHNRYSWYTCSQGLARSKYSRFLGNWLVGQHYVEHSYIHYASIQYNPWKSWNVIALKKMYSLVGPTTSQLFTMKFSWHGDEFSFIVTKRHKLATVWMRIISQYIRRYHYFVHSYEMDISDLSFW